MNELIEVLSNITSGGSGTGLSYYSNPCGRHAALSKIYGRDESTPDQSVGTIGHKLLELYYTGKLTNVVLPYEDAPGLSDSVQEALRCFRSYVHIFPRDEWTVVGAEIQLEGPAVEVAVGVSPFTGRLDLVVDISEEQSAHLRDKRNGQIRAGRWVVDHKFRGKKDSLAQVKYEMAHQANAYPTAYAAKFPEVPIQGTIFNEIIRHTDLTKKDDDGSLRSFKSFVIEAPGPTAKKALAQHLNNKKNLLILEQPNLDACVGHQICRFWREGLCDRT